MAVFNEPVEFVWDKGNKDKNWLKHKVSNQECEEVFEDKNKKIFKDPVHSQTEKRYILIGMTKNEKLLFIVFTMRNEKVRIISARNINKKERRLYEEKIDSAEV